MPFPPHSRDGCKIAPKCFERSSSHSVIVAHILLQSTDGETIEQHKTQGKHKERQEAVLGGRIANMLVVRPSGTLTFSRAIEFDQASAAALHAVRFLFKASATAAHSIWYRRLSSIDRIFGSPLRQSFVRGAYLGIGRRRKSASGAWSLKKVHQHGQSISRLTTFVGGKP